MKTKGSFFEKLIRWTNHFTKSLVNFVKSSILSLVIIVIILLLLTQMDQAFTMMVDLIESHWLSLFLSFLFINALAIVLSHYPIYTYYAANLNNSGNYTIWKKAYAKLFWPFNKLPIFIFFSKKDVGYTPDRWANYLRYLIGLLIHGVWIHFIISSFNPNLVYDNFPLTLVKIFAYCFLIVPFILYIILKRRFANYTSEGLLNEKLNKNYKKLGIWYFIIALTNLLLLIITLFVGNFSPGGFILILITSYTFMFNYVFFRLLRTKLTRVKSTLTSPLLIPVYVFINALIFLEKSQNYILLFLFNFIAALSLIFYATLASINGWILPNGIPILLAFFYFYYFIIANLKKYFFVVRKMELLGSNKYKALFAVCIIITTLLVITKFADIEVRTHELDLVENSEMEISEQVFTDSIQAKNNKTLFFIASHGGGLKANVWTLNVLNALQKQTKGNLLNQTIALSGASGGSLGFALYTGLMKENGDNTEEIQKKIDRLARQNYTSLDLTLTFGIDSYRKLWPFSQRIGIRDRPYYAMVKYQNTIEDIQNKELSNTAFREYWAITFNRNGYFPSLIMNTAGTKGNRGILWSVKQKDFNSVFPYAENLADLPGGKTLPYYQAVSTTNRFPIFSPAAKIPGYGHYIDAGAIDNSGLLGCLDVHNYLQRDTLILKDKHIAYIEIINSKSLYIKHLLEKFKKDEGGLHLSKDENETDNILADLKTGLNLDKIPEYLSDYISNQENANGSSLSYYRLFMPHKVSIDDVEEYLDGRLTNSGTIDKLTGFLKIENALILAITEKPDKKFFDPWEFYEPTLSRHLSESSLNYIDAILKHPYLIDQFKNIELQTNPN